MLQKLKNKIIILATVMAALAPAGVMVSSTVYAEGAVDPSTALCNGANVQYLNDPTHNCVNTTASNTDSLEAKVAHLINIFSVVVGIVAVVMVIYGGFRYVTSGGKQESVTNAKNTLLYAVVGLVIVALSQAIVHFVLKNTTA